MSLVFDNCVSKFSNFDLRSFVIVVVQPQHLYEKSWYAVTETCLAMSIFRDEFDASFLAWFTLLLFLKIFHWLSADRVDYVCTSPAHVL